MNKILFGRRKKEFFRRIDNILPIENPDTPEITPKEGAYLKGLAKAKEIFKEVFEINSKTKKS